MKCWHLRISLLFQFQDNTNVSMLMKNVSIKKGVRIVLNACYRPILKRIPFVMYRPIGYMYLLIEYWISDWLFGLTGHTHGLYFKIKPSLTTRHFPHLPHFHLDRQKKTFRLGFDFFFFKCSLRCCHLESNFEWSKCS